MKPPRPTILRIALVDYWPIGILISSLTLLLISLGIFFGMEHTGPFWEIFYFLFFGALGIGLLLLPWLVKRVRHIHQVWEKGDLVTARFSGRSQHNMRNAPIHIFYKYEYKGQVYSDHFATGARTQFPIRDNGDIPLIVNPDNPKEVLPIDVYYA